MKVQTLHLIRVITWSETKNNNVLCIPSVLTCSKPAALHFACSHQETISHSWENLCQSLWRWKLVSRCPGSIWRRGNTCTHIHTFLSSRLAILRLACWVFHLEIGLSRVKGPNTTDGRWWKKNSTLFYWKKQSNYAHLCPQRCQKVQSRVEPQSYHRRQTLSDNPQSIYPFS